MQNEITDDEIGQVLIGAPKWITVAAMRDTLNSLQTEYKEPMTADDALAILLNMGNLFSVLKFAPKIKG